MSYHSSGIAFQWDHIRLLIPYDRLPLKFPIDWRFLEEFKTGFQGEITIFFECDRINFNIEILDVKTEPWVIRKFKEVVSGIEDIIHKIKSVAGYETFTLGAARSILQEEGFHFDDGKARRIAAEIVNSMPMQHRESKVSIPLSGLSFLPEGIRFHHRNMQFEVNKERLPFEIGPILDKIKSSLEGDMTFHFEFTYFLRWDVDRNSVQTGNVDRQVNRVEINQDTLQAFKTLRGHRVCDAIKRFADKAAVTLGQVKLILKEWGLNVNHREIANRIIATIPPWSEKKDFKVPLKKIIFHDYKIEVLADGGKITISASDLPFKTNRILEKIKYIFEGYIKVHMYQPYQFTWNHALQQLDIERRKAVKVRIDIDEDALKKFEKISWLYIKLLGKVAPIIAEGLLRRKLKPTDKVPYEKIANKGYDIEYIKHLEKISEEIYPTEEDLWFRKGNCLVWERPIPGAATYIFKWPEEELELFIARIWISELLDIRNNREESGFITRVIHTNVYNWEISLKRTLRKKCQKKRNF